MAERLAEGARARLGSTPSVVRALLEGMPEELVTAPLDGEWCARDVVAHLVVGESVVLRARLAGMRAAPGGAIANVDEEEALEASGLRGLAAGELLDRFAVERGESLALLDGFSTEELALSGEHELVGSITAAEMVNQISYHDAVHIEQIARMLAVSAELERGGLRQF